MDDHESLLIVCGSIQQTVANYRECADQFVVLEQTEKWPLIWIRRPSWG